MKILRDNYTPRKFQFPLVVFCKYCNSALKLSRNDVECNKHNDIDICVEVTYICPLCNKMNWVQQPTQSE